MSSDKIVDHINGYNDATIGGLFKALKQLKITTLIALATISFSFLSGIFMLGRQSNQKEIAIELKKPFDIKINNGPELKDVVLVKDNSLIEEDDSLVVYDLKQIQTEFSDKVIGQVVIKKEIINAR